MSSQHFASRLRPVTLVLLAALLCVSLIQRSDAREPAGRFLVIAYVHGGAADLEKHPLQHLTHVNYCFLRLHGNRLVLHGERDSIGISRLVALKKNHPGLKILLSVGGWGGCEPCSEVFSTAEGRREFTQSAKDILVRFGADGIDMDWEYPAVEGYPGHRFVPEDRENFTALLQEMRAAFGDRYEITFAAGGFGAALCSSVEWDRVMPLVDNVNIMTYDLVNGNSVRTGHHTSLYSTSEQHESTDDAIRILDSLKVPMNKVVIGAAFYARVWEGVDSVNNGLYRSGKFKTYAGYRSFEERLWRGNSFVQHWDSVACAPYAYDPKAGVFATYDDKRSVGLKTAYALKKGLGGIMFWELTGDAEQDGLLEVIATTKEKEEGRRKKEKE